MTEVRLIHETEIDMTIPRHRHVMFLIEYADAAVLKDGHGAVLDAMLNALASLAITLRMEPIIARSLRIFADRLDTIDQSEIDEVLLRGRRPEGRA